MSYFIGFITLKYYFFYIKNTQFVFILRPLYYLDWSWLLCECIICVYIWLQLYEDKYVCYKLSPLMSNPNYSIALAHSNKSYYVCHALSSLILDLIMYYVI